MPMYDLTCEDGHQLFDQWLKLGERPPCPTCQKPTTTLWLPSSCPNVIGDDIPGGILIKHGICASDGTPIRYYSKSDMVKAAKAKGLANVVTHRPIPGSDKSPHTTRWV